MTKRSKSDPLADIYAYDPLWQASTTPTTPEQRRALSKLAEEEGIPLGEITVEQFEELLRKAMEKGG